MNSSYLSAHGTPWLALESIPDLCAMPCAWEAYLNHHFPVFRLRFLRPNQGLAYLPEGTGPLHFSWDEFGPAFARAFGCTPVASRDLGNNTRQVGAWSCEGTPVFLTCNADPLRFELAILKLCAAFDRPFIVFAPSKRFLNAECLAYLEHKRCACFDLRSTLMLTPSGVLQASITPGELFSAFAPAPERTDRVEAASRAFMLVKRLDAERPARPPFPSTVLQLYSVDCLSLSQVARRCRSSKATVHRRLCDLERILGVHPRHLRQCSSHLEKLYGSANTGLARNIHAQSLIYDDAASEEP